MTTFYTVYEIETGRIISVASCDASQMPDEGPQYDGSDTAIIHGRSDPDQDRVRRNKIVKKTKTELRGQELASAWFNVRQRRFQMLTESDWTQMPDAPVDREAWAAYRQALRDLPANTPDPHNPEWPEVPE